MEYVPELQRRRRRGPGPKRYGDAFEATDLDPSSPSAVSGASSSPAPRPTSASGRRSHGAFVRGYDTTLVSDAHTTEDLSEWGAPPPEKVVDHTNLYWQFQAGPGRTAEVVAAADLEF